MGFPKDDRTPILANIETTISCSAPNKEPYREHNLRQ